jgi:hypothetical protein
VEFGGKTTRANKMHDELSISLLGHSNFELETKNKIQCLFWDIVILISKKIYVKQFAIEIKIYV